MKKIVTLFMALIASVSMAFAYDGLMSGNEEVKVVSTKYFDIIYPASSSQTAYELSLVADDIYKDVCTTLSSSSQIRMPVVITNSMEVFNAYYSNTAYNHIVLFDTVTEESMSVFSDTINDTFRHELTHALTFNHTSPLFRSVLNYTGDLWILVPGIFIPQFVSEGSSVAFESMGDGGRLKDEYYLHMIKQSKLSGKFPSWRLVQGAQDSFPGGSLAYGFGGPFIEYLQKTYGMEKYGAWWYRMVNLKSVGLQRSFKAIYGISLNDAWKAYEEQIQVPAIEKDPLKVDGVASFFNGTKNDKLSRYVNVVNYDGGIFYTDTSLPAVFKAERNADGSYGKAKKVLDSWDVESFSVSRDGKFMAVAGICENHQAMKMEVTVYNTEKSSSLKLPGTGVSNATVVKNGEDYYVAVLKNEGQNTKLQMYKIVQEKGKIKSFLLEKEIPFVRGAVAFSLTDAGNGTLAYIYKEGLNWSVREVPVAGESSEITVYVNPSENLRIRYLNASLDEQGNRVYSFSYTLPGFFPRLGLLKTNGETAEWKLMNEELSGGVYSNAVAGNKAVYSAYFVDNYKMFTLDLSKFSFAESRTAVNKEAVYAGAEGKSEELIAFENRSTDYPQGVPARWSVSPVYNVETVIYDPIYGNTRRSDLGFGASVYVTNPWDSMNLQVGVGYDPTSSLTSIGFDVTGGSNTSIYNYNVAVNGTFSTETFEQAIVDSHFSSVVYVAEHAAFVFSNKTNAFAGRLMFETVSSDNMLVRSLSHTTDFYAYGYNVSSARFTNIHNTGSGRYQQLGFSVGMNYAVEALFQFPTDTKNFGLVFAGQGLYPSVTVRLPQLLPLDCVNGFTYNLPVAMNIALCPTSSIFARLNSEVVLAGIPIHNAFKFLPFYFNRMEITACYDAAVYSAADSYSIFNPVASVQNLKGAALYDNVSFGFMMEARINIGKLAGAELEGLGLEVTYNIHGIDNPENKLSYSFKTSIMF